MITTTTYTCELCAAVHATAEKALACEGHGWPAPIPWLSTDAGIVPVFDGCGFWFSYRGISDCRLVRSKSGDGHSWEVWLQEVIENDPRADAGGHFWVRADDFDPRLIPVLTTPGNAEWTRDVWAEAMRRYGFTLDEVRNRQDWMYVA